MARPRGQFYKMDKRNNPDRRRIMEKGKPIKHLSEEEKKQHILNWQTEYYVKLKDEEERLAPYREPITLLKTKEERDEFRKYVNQKNKKRLDEILADEELMWQIFADRADISAVEVRQLQKKAKEKKSYVTDKEIEQAMMSIYGGVKIKGTILDDVEKEDDDEYINPYKPINEED